MKIEEAMGVITPNVEGSLSSAMAKGIRDVVVSIHMKQPSRSYELEVNTTYKFGRDKGDEDA